MGRTVDSVVPDLCRGESGRPRRRSEGVHTDMEPTRKTLREISDLLARYGYHERSKFVRGVAQDEDPNRFWRTVAGLEFWGGSGAVWEVEPFYSSHPDIEDSARDYRRFQFRMLGLADALEQKGLADLARRNADLFRREMESDG